MLKRHITARMAWYGMQAWRRMAKRNEETLAIIYTTYDVNSRKMATTCVRTQGQTPYRDRKKNKRNKSEMKAKRPSATMAMAMK